MGLLTIYQEQSQHCLQVDFGNFSMINRFIYTLYLFSRYRKLTDKYLASGGLIFLWSHLNLFALAKLICVQLNLSFVDIFYEYRLVYLLVVVLFYFGSISYANFLIKRIQSGTLKIKKTSLQKVCLFMAISMFFFLTVMIFL